MTDLSERYLVAALRGVPGGQRADVERELRGAIDDAVEDRVNAGEPPDSAERAVLEGLGDPARLAAGITGKPLHLIGPDLFIPYRNLLLTLLSIVMPIVGIVLAGVAIADGSDVVGALLAGIGGAWTVGIHLFFWVTITFVAIERLDAMRDARDEFTGAMGRWTVDQLPALPQDRVSAGEVAGEVLTTVLTIGGLLFLYGAGWFTDAAGAAVTVFNPGLPTLWLPALIIVLGAIAVVQVAVYFVGRWTIPLAAGYALLELAFAVPVVWLALNGALVNPAFAEAIGWPPLSDGDGIAMIALAVTVALVTGYEIFDAFRRARRADARATISAVGEGAG